MKTFTKVYLVPEDSMKKFREEIQHHTLLDVEMSKILKMKIDDIKKWYLYRDTLIKASNLLRSRPETADTAINYPPTDTPLQPERRFFSRNRSKSIAISGVKEHERDDADDYDNSIEFPSRNRSKSVLVTGVKQLEDDIGLTEDDDTFYEADADTPNTIKKKRKLAPKKLFPAKESSTPRQESVTDSFFSGLFSYLKPLLFSGISAIKDQTIKSGSNILANIGQKPIKEILKEEGKNALLDLTERGVKKLRKMQKGKGKKRIKRKQSTKKKHSKTKRSQTATQTGGKKGKKRPKKTKSTSKPKKTRFVDIFDNKNG